MKKILALILALLIMMTVFAGCGNSADESDNDFDVNVIEEDDSQEDTIVLSIDAFNNAEGTGYELEYTSFGATETIGAIEILLYEGGKTVSECFAEDGYEDIKLIGEDSENFLGWMEYEIEVKVDADGCEYNSYKKVSEELYTTQEIMEKVMPDHGVGYVAKWKDALQEDYDYLEQE